MEISERITSLLQEYMSKMDEKFGKQTWKTRVDPYDGYIVGVVCDLDYEGEDDESEDETALGLFPVVDMFGDYEEVIYKDDDIQCGVWIDDGYTFLNIHSAFADDENDTYSEYVLSELQTHTIANKVAELLGLSFDE